MPVAMPAWSGSALALGKALTRSGVSSAGPTPPQANASAASSSHGGGREPYASDIDFPLDFRGCPDLHRPSYIAHAGRCIDQRTFNRQFPVDGGALEPSGKLRMRAISLDEALKLINGTFAAAAERKLRPLTAVVLDAGGRVKAALKQDGCSMLRFEIAYGKAYAALALGRSSRLVLQKSREKPIFMDNLQKLADGPMFLEGGGQLIRDAAGEVVGAIGVTGDVNEMDDLCGGRRHPRGRLQERLRFRRPGRHPRHEHQGRRAAEGAQGAEAVSRRGDSGAAPGEVVTAGGGSGAAFAISSPPSGKCWSEPALSPPCRGTTLDSMIGGVPHGRFLLA